MNWQQAWWITKHEVKDEWRTLLIILFINSFFASIAANWLYATDPESLSFIDTYRIDIIFLILIPNFVTIYLSSHYFRAAQMKDDIFTRQMALYRILPISLEVLTVSRIIKMILLYLIQTILFFAVFMIVLFQNHPEVSFTSILCFVLFWFGVCFAIGSILPVVEAGSTVKVFNLFSFVFIAVFLVVYSLIEIYLGYGLVLLSLQWIEQGGWYLAVIGPLLGCLVCYFWGRILYQQLKKRDYR